MPSVLTWPWWVIEFEDHGDEEQYILHVEHEVAQVGNSSRSTTNNKVSIRDDLKWFLEGNP
jgi:hypothetical protein